MATTKQATYKQFNGTDWDTIYFKTSAGQVGESSTLYFLRPATHKVNGKSFYGTTHQGITLYATDITLNSSSSITIKGQLDTYDQQIAGLEDMINKLDYASSDHDHDSTYFKLSNVLGYETFHSEEDVRYGRYVLENDYVQDNDHVVSAGALHEILLDFATDGHTHSNASTSAAGFMSAADKKSLDTLAAFLTDGNTSYIDTLSEMLEVFKTYPEGTDIYTLLSGKVDKTSILDGNDVGTVADLSAYKATDVISAPALMNALDYYAANDHDHDSTYFKLSNVLGYETFHSEEDVRYGRYVLENDYVQDNDHVVSAGALHEILLDFATDGHTHSDYLLKTGGVISGDLEISQRILVNYAEIYELEIFNGESDQLAVEINPEAGLYKIEGKNISTTNIYYGSTDPKDANNTNNVQTGDIWLQY